MRGFAVRHPRTGYVASAVAVLAVAGVIGVVRSDAGGETRPRFAPALDPHELNRPPRPLLHSAGDRPVAAQQSTWCWAVRGRGAACADYAERPPEGRAVRASRRGELLVDMRVPADSLAVLARERASLSAPAIELAARRHRGSSRIWGVRIPARLARRLRVIKLFARYPQGDGLFLAPMRSRR